MKFYVNLILLQLKSQMQYKASFFLTIAGQFLTAFTSFFSISFVFDWVDAVDGFTYGQVLLCFAVVMASFSLGEMVGGGLAVFPRKLGNGEFDRALVRPRSILLQILMPNVDFTRLGLLLQAAVVLFIAVPASGVSWNGKKILLLCLMIFCGSIFYSGKPELHEYIHVWGTAVWPVSLFHLWERRAHIFDMGGAVGPFSILPAFISAGSGEK